MDGMTDKAHWMAAARSAMQTEAGAVLAASERLGDSLLESVALILGSSGKVIVTGMGKSGHIARKIAATLQSTGTPAVFLHPTEAGHGDLGMCQSGDAVVMISKSGCTAELLDLVAPLREFDARFIGILGNLRSPLAAEMDVVLDASVLREADPEGYTPTASTVVALALGHAAGHRPDAGTWASVRSISAATIPPANWDTISACGCAMSCMRAMK